MPPTLTLPVLMRILRTHRHAWHGSHSTRHIAQCSMLNAQSAWAVRSTSPHNPLRSHSIGPVDHRVSTRKRTAKNIALVFFEFAGLLPMQIKKIAPEMRSPTKLHGENSCGACRIQNRRRPATRRSSNFRHLTDAWKGAGRYRIHFPVFGPQYILGRRCELVSRCRL